MQPINSTNPKKQTEKLHTQNKPTTTKKKRIQNIIL
jgi:hypothetical protein